MALALSSPMTTLASSLLRRRPLAPLAVSSPTGTTTAVPPPTTSRVPAGTMFGAPQQFGVPSSTMVSALRSTMPRPAVAPTAQPVAPAPGGMPVSRAMPPAPAIAPPAPAAPPPAPPRPAIAPPAQPPTGGQPGQFGANISDITGAERPQAINPGASVTDPLQQQTQDEASRALANPSAYDDTLFQQEVSRGRESLDADIASRGLDYSTIAPQLFSSRVLQPLLSERARTISADRQRAQEVAQGVIGQRTGLEAQGRGELRGERGYTDTLRERARQNEIERYQLGEGQFQTTLQQALASGDPSRALAALQSAAYGMGGPASAYGAQAEATGSSLQDLAQSFIEQFYGNRGA